MCTEMPEARFDDYYCLPIPAEIWQPNEPVEIWRKIDGTFLAVCEPGSIVPVSAIADSPVASGVQVTATHICVTVVGPLPPTQIFVRISGIRRGHAGTRFPPYTATEAAANLRFWDQWRTQ